MRGSGTEASEWRDAGESTAGGAVLRVSASEASRSVQVAKAFACGRHGVGWSRAVTLGTAGQLATGQLLVNWPLVNWTWGEMLWGKCHGEVPLGDRVGRYRGEIPWTWPPVSWREGGRCLRAGRTALDTTRTTD